MNLDLMPFRKINSKFIIDLNFKHRIRKLDYTEENLDDLGYAVSVLNKTPRALAGVAQWIECQPVNQRVTSLIPSQSTCLH